MECFLLSNFSYLSLQSQSDNQESFYKVEREREWWHGSVSQPAGEVV